MKTQTKLPERITALVAVTYDVEQIVEDLTQWKDVEPDSVTLEQVMERVKDYATEDVFDAGNEIVFQDEQGNEVEV